jgi:hypothetical protein
MKLRKHTTSPFPEDQPHHRPDFRYGANVGLYDSSLWTGIGAWGGYSFDPPLSWVLWRRWSWALRNWITRQHFRCRVCGVQCDTAPIDSGFWRSTAVCPVHCEDHDYEYCPDMRERCCIHCGDPLPYDSRG